MTWPSDSGPHASQLVAFAGRCAGSPVARLNVPSVRPVLTTQLGGFVAEGCATGDGTVFEDWIADCTGGPTGSVIPRRVDSQGTFRRGVVKSCPRGSTVWITGS